MFPKSPGYVGNPQIKEVTTYIDKNGKELSELKVENADLKEQLKNIKISPRGTPTSIDRIITKVDTVFIKTPITHTTDEGFSMHKQDPYLDLTIIGNGDDASIGLSMIDTLTTVHSTVSHLFKPTEHILTISNTNPYNRIKAGQSLTYPEKKDIFDISIFLGYDPIRNSPTVGIGISKSIIHIRK